MRDFLGNALGYQKKEQARANVIIGTLTGLLVGTAAGLLFAPQSGKETREDIKKTAEKGYEKVVDASQDVADYVKEKSKEASIKFHEAKDITKAKLQKGVAESADKVAEKAEDISDDLEAAED